MTRATAAEIKKLFGDNWPGSWSDTSVGGILDGIDYRLDGFVKRHYKTTLSTTDTSVVHIANLIGKEIVIDAVNVNSEAVRTPIFTHEIVTLIEAVISDTTEDGAVILELEGAHRV